MKASSLETTGKQRVKLYRLCPFFFVGVASSKTASNVWVVLFLATLWLPKKIKTPHNQMITRHSLYSKRDLNPHSRNGQRILSPSCLPFHHSSILKRERRAENETRTRDPNLGKVMLYQLSYFRIWRTGAKINSFPVPAKFFLIKCSQNEAKNLLSL